MRRWVGKVLCKLGRHKEFTAVDPATDGWDWSAVCTVCVRCRTVLLIQFKQPTQEHP